MSIRRKILNGITALTAAIAIAVAAAPVVATASEGEEQSRLKEVSTNPDGTVNCAPRTMCHPLYNECC